MVNRDLLSRYNYDEFVSEKFRPWMNIEYFLGTITRRSAGEQLAPFHVERLDLRNQDRAAFYAGLERNGPKAVREYRAVFG